MVSLFFCMCFGHGEEKIRMCPITSSVFLDLFLLVLFYVISDMVMEKSFCVLLKVYVLICGLSVPELGFGNLLCGFPLFC